MRAIWRTFPILRDQTGIFFQADICDPVKMSEILQECQPDLLMHLAAESHVDRSIDGPGDFIRTNIVGTYTLLEVVRDYLGKLDKTRTERFRFHHISTDEVYGSLGDKGMFNRAAQVFTQLPYSASKASSDHLVRAWGATYGVPTLITNCSNNYGPFHFPEKLIPLMIQNALSGQPLPIYGRGIKSGTGCLWRTMPGADSVAEKGRVGRNL